MSFRLFTFIALVLPFFASPARALHRTESSYVNAAIDTCRNTTGCEITRDEGVWRDPGESHGNGRSPRSCHIVGRAIDITGVRCSDGMGGEDAVMRFKNCLWWYISNFFS